HLANSPQATATQLILYSFFYHIVQRIIIYHQLHTFIFKQFGVLFDQGILWFGEYTFQDSGIKRIEVGNDRQTAQQFENQTKSTQILCIHILQQVGTVQLFAGFDSIVTDSRCLHTTCDHLVNTFKRTTTYEEDILGIYFYHLLLRVLAATLWWYQYFRAFQQFQHSLLHTLTAHVAGDGGVITFTAYLIYFVYINDTTLCGCHIKIASLQQARQDAFHILTYIPCLGKYRSIYYSKRHL